MSFAKAALAAAFAAFLLGMLLHVVVPGSLGAIFSTIVSGATLLDPLHASGRVRSVWSGYGGVLFIHGLHAFVTGPVLGVVVAAWVSRSASRNAYLVTAILSLFLHTALLGIYGLVLSAIRGTWIPGTIWGISMVISLLAAPMIALGATFAARLILRRNPSLATGSMDGVPQ